MYSPVLSETMVKTLYRLKCSQDKPMTVVAEKLTMGQIERIWQQVDTKKENDPNQFSLLQKRLLKQKQLKTGL